MSNQRVLFVRCVVCTLIVLFPLSAAFAPPLRKRPSTTVQLPTFGVSVDAQGLLSLKIARDQGGRLHRQRIDAAQAALPADLARVSELRKVSLVRLEKAIAQRLAAGEPPDDVMRNLAGLQRIEYAFCYPDQSDLVLAGPAEGWVADGVGRSVGLTSGQPVVQLVDLLVALRAYPPGGVKRPFIGCTINPTAEGLSRLQDFQRTVPRSVSTSERRQVLQYVARGTQQALGMAEIRTFGVADTTHFAHVMIEADYRMKLIGIGLEQPPIKLASYLSLLRTASHGSLQRWWFTPDYECVRVAEDKLAVQMVGQGVQLQTEDKVILPGGVLGVSTRGNRASEQFCAGFTAKYDALSAASPVYAQLRTLIDLLVAAAFLQRENYYGQIDWSAAVLRDEDRLPTQTEPAMQKVPAAVNAVWKGSRLLAPAGGGVSIHPHLALESDKLLKDTDGQVAQQHDYEAKNIPPDAWWWD